MGDEIKVKNMSTIVIVLMALSVVTLMGMALTNQYSLVLRDNTASTVTAVTVVNETAVLVGTTGQFPFLQTLTNCVNATTAVVLTAANFTVLEGDVDGGFITLASAASVDFNNSDVNCSLTYLAGTDGQISADNFTAGLGVFGTFSAVIALAIVGLIIISLFRKKDD